MKEARLLFIYILFSNLIFAQNFKTWDQASIGENPQYKILEPDSIKPLIDSFNQDYENYRDFVPKGNPSKRNGDLITGYLDTTSYVKVSDSYNWLINNIPLFDTPDEFFKETYYFRWWVLLRHLKKLKDFFVFSEFPQKVSWGDKYNVINCPDAHQIYEARWLNDPEYAQSYISYFFKSGICSIYLYNTWLIDAALALDNVNHDVGFLMDNYSDFCFYENKLRDRNIHNKWGMFWASDWFDGMEYQIDGSGIRPSINSYMYGDAIALSEISQIIGETSDIKKYHEIALDTKEKIQSKLWDEESQFFKTLKNKEGRNWDSITYASKKNLSYYPIDYHKLGELVNVRELIGYMPWYFNLPDSGYETAWAQIMNPNGFYAPYGRTTAEQRHPLFYAIRYKDGPYGKDKKLIEGSAWDGPSCPFTNTTVLVAMANLINNYDQQVIKKEDYFKILENYTYSHYKPKISLSKIKPAGTRPRLGQDYDDITGDWVQAHPNFYFHSGYIDLIISGLMGVHAQNDNVLEINPLIPENKWEYFCIDGIHFRGHYITILYDKDGSRYNSGKGFKEIIDGIKKIALDDIKKVQIDLGI